MTQPSASKIVLVSAHRPLIDEVLAVAAAVTVAPTVISDPSSLLACWAWADTVLIGQDLADAVAALSLPPGPAIYLVGTEASRLSEWSMPLRASVVELPGGVAWLTGILTGGGNADTAPVVAVVGASGGVGASTLAAGLAYRAAQRGTATVLVDADPLGGGIDLLLGAERVSGWRWDRFAHAEGQMGDLRPVLPSVEGLDLLSTGRRSATQLAREPVSAVIGSLRRTHEFVVIDTGRGPSPGSLECRRLATIALLVVGCSVRAVAAAQQTLADWSGPLPRLVLRQGVTHAINADILGQKLGLPIAGSVPEERDVAAAAERGDPPGRSVRRSRWARACANLLETVL